ncbi:MAG: GTP-binding protein, partial [Ketobacter sp.]
MAELKFVITGTAGVGKTTAICALSDVPPVATDADTTDELSLI